MNVLNSWFSVSSTLLNQQIWTFTGIFQLLDFHSDEEHESIDMQTPRTSALFEHGFFELRLHMSNRNIKANCMTCQRMGRQNLIQAREDSSSNLLAHLKVMDKCVVNKCFFFTLTEIIWSECHLKRSQNMVSIEISSWKKWIYSKPPHYWQFNIDK